MTKIEKVILENLLAQSLCLEHILSATSGDMARRRRLMTQIDESQNSILILLQNEEEFDKVSA